jgi:serine phosphatase RsbU (regulator of sigma subunit)
MAKLSGEVRYCLAAEPDPARAVSQINASFCRSGWDDRFVTFVLTVLDPKRNEVCIVNAGHMPPFIRHQCGNVDALGESQSGLPLGVDTDYRYESCNRELLPGECLVAFTDGFSEAMNSEGELYGLERLETQIAAPGVSSVSLGRRILDDVKTFVGSHPQSDDMCLACFGRCD